MVIPSGTPQVEPGQATPPTTPDATQFGTAPAPSTGTQDDAVIKAEVHKQLTTKGRELAEKYRQRELTAAKGDEGLTASIMARQEQERIQEETEATLSQAKITEQTGLRALADAKSLLANSTADALAAQYGVSKDLLVQYSGGDSARMAAIVPTLMKADPNAPVATPPATPAAPVVPVISSGLPPSTLQPDSNVAAGSGGIDATTLTAQDIKNIPVNQLREASEAVVKAAKSTPMGLPKP